MTIASAPFIHLRLSAAELAGSYEKPIEQTRAVNIVLVRSPHR